MARGARGWLAAVGLCGLVALAAGARAPAAGAPALRLGEAAAPAETRSRVELVLPEGTATPVAFKDMTVSVIATVNKTTGLALVDDSVDLFAGTWDPQPPEVITKMGSGYTPLAFKVSGDDEQHTHVNGTAEYTYVEGKRLAFAFVVTDGAAAFETIWSRGTLAQTFLTLAGSEVICTVLYSDLPEVADS